MPTSYSVRFLVGYGVGKPWTYVVPAGHRAVIRDVQAANFDTVPQTFQLGIQGVMVIVRSLPASTGALSLACYMVVYAGENMDMFTAGPSMRSVVSGYLFRDEIATRIGSIRPGIEELPSYIGGEPG